MSDLSSLTRGAGRSLLTGDLICAPGGHSRTIRLSHFGGGGEAGPTEIEVGSRLYRRLAGDAAL